MIVTGAGVGSCASEPAVRPKAATTEALLEGARSGDTGSAESATGYYWGEKKLRPFVELIRAKADSDGDERLAQLAARFLR